MIPGECGSLRTEIRTRRQIGDSLRETPICTSPYPRLASRDPELRFLIQDSLRETPICTSPYPRLDSRDSELRFPLSKTCSAMQNCKPHPSIIQRSASQDFKTPPRLISLFWARWRPAISCIEISRTESRAIGLRIGRDPRTRAWSSRLRDGRI